MEPDKDGFRFIGKPVRRAEDERLVTGKGRFSDDFKLDHQAYAAMVRSPHPMPASAASIRRAPAPCQACSASSPVPIAWPTISVPSRTIRCPRPNTT